MYLRILAVSILGSWPVIDPLPSRTPSSTQKDHGHITTHCARSHEPKLRNMFPIRCREIEVSPHPLIKTGKN